jgi:DNA invertase Pin-like site-specific DNA recombinase
MPVLTKLKNNTHWFMPSDKKKCYSYIRWSSDKQSGGSTLARQLKYATDFVAKNDLELVEMIDSGISAFKGKNAATGELGRFIDAVENKLIPSDSWLIVENLDRLSRQNPMKATRLFTDIIELGITIVTAMDNRVYDLETIDKNPFELITSILLFARAHEESKTKSNRTYGHALDIIEKHIEGERSADGYAIAIRSVGSNMWWTDCSDGSVKPHRVYFDIAKEIIGLAIDGMGSHSITAYLNKTYTGILPKTKSNKEGVWSLNRVSQFLQKRSMIGEKAITLDGIDYVLNDYYPALCDEETFYKMRGLRQGRTQKPEHTDKVYLFLGRDIIKCGHCGAKMTSHTSNENKAKGKYNKFRYKCSSGANATGKCRAWTFNAIWLDDVVVRLAANHIFRPLNQAAEFDVAINGLEINVQDKQKNIDNLIDLAKQGLAPKSVLKEITVLEVDIERLNSAIETGKLNRAVELTETVEWGEVDERVLDYHEHELRQQLKDKVRLSVKQVICQQVKAKLVKFTITFVNDITIVAYRSPMTLVFDGLAWNKLGDFYKAPVNLSSSEQYINKIEGDTTPVDKGVLKNELGDLAEFIIDAPVGNIGENDIYEYKGLDNVSHEMMTLLKTGQQPKHLMHDLMRVEHLTDWAVGFSKDVPKIIESQFTTFKHKYKSHIGHKAKPAIHYIDEVTVGLSGTITDNAKANNTDK